MWILLDLTFSKGAGIGTVSCDLERVQCEIGPLSTLGYSTGGGLGLVYLTKWLMIISSAEGQDLVIFSYVKHGHEG